MLNIKVLDRRKEIRREADRKEIENEHISSNVFSYLIGARHDFYKEISWLQSLRFKLFYVYLIMFSGIFYIFSQLYKLPHDGGPYCQYCFGGIAILVLYVISLLFAIRTSIYTCVINSDIMNIGVIHDYINDYIKDKHFKEIKFNKVNEQDESFSNYLSLRGRPATTFIFPIISVSSIFLYLLFVFSHFLNTSVFGNFVYSLFISFLFLSVFYSVYRRPVETRTWPKSIVATIDRTYISSKRDHEHSRENAL